MTTSDTTSGTTSERSLDALFEPSSVAVWGASARDERKLGNVLLRNAASSPFASISAVHPTATSIDGIDAAPQPTEPIDLALISLPAAAVEQAVSDACDGGARAAIVLSSGFAEAGETGRATEQRLVERARGAGMSLVGPNCMGVVSRTAAGWFNGTYFWSVPLQPGSIGFISQSGAFGGVFFNEIRRRKIGMSRFISVGNSADVNETDALEWLADDDQTSVIGIFCEELGGGRRFIEAAQRAAERKPVVLLKSGKAASGARAAAGHTGALTSDHLVVQAALRRAGVIEAADTSEFFDVLHGAAAPMSAQTSGDRLAIVTVSGGPSVLAADAVDRTGLTLPEASDELQRQLRPLIPDFAATANPFDLTPQCDPRSFEPAIDLIYASDEIDRVVVINCGIDSTVMADAVVAASRTHSKPTTSFLLDTPNMSEIFVNAGIAVLDRPESAVVAARSGTRA